MQAKKCFVFINPNSSLFQILFLLDVADYLSVLLAVDKEMMLCSTGAGKKYHSLCKTMDFLFLGNQLLSELFNGITSHSDTGTKTLVHKYKFTPLNSPLIQSLCEKS